MNSAEISSLQNQGCPLYAIAKNQQGSNANWLEVWGWFAECPEFTALVHSIALRLLRKYSIPLEWRRDIEQESAIYFASILQRKPNLGYDSNLGTFKGWLFVILNGCCLKAIRQFKDSLRQRCVPQWQPSVRTYCSDPDVLIDLDDLIERLDPKLKSPMLEYLCGKSVEEISSSTGIGQRTIYRRIHSAIEEIKRALTY